MSVLDPCRDRLPGSGDDAHRRIIADPAKLAVSAALWLGAALVLTGVGLFIARSLESGLLGFLGADFVFLIAMSIYTSGQAGLGRHRH